MRKRYTASAEKVLENAGKEAENSHSGGRFYRFNRRLLAKTAVPC